MDYDVLLAKASTVQRCIARISQTLGAGFPRGEVLFLSWYVVMRRID